MYVFHIGVSGLPDNSAGSNRIFLTLKGLKELGCTVFIINKQSVTSDVSSRIKMKDGVPCVFTSSNIRRPGNFIKRNFNKISGIFGEFALLKKREKKLTAGILYTPYFIELVYYRLISKVFGFKLLVQFVEMRSSLPERTAFFTKINDLLFERYVSRLSDGVIAISDVLAKHAKSKLLSAQIIKLPAICNFSEFNFTHLQQADRNYMMYCGSIVYIDVIDFIIELFTELKKKQIYNSDLILVISGTDVQNRNSLNKKILECGFKESIHLKSNLIYMDLISLYKGADLLLIPLRKSLQDNARFPHKIGEYTASQRPILSTNTGELKLYFEDGVSAILAEDYAVSSYVAKLSEVKLSTTMLQTIGSNGYNIGFENFDYRGQAIKLKAFLETLL